jgi:amidase
MQALYDQQDVACNSTSEFWEMCQEREDYRQAYADYWIHMDGQTASNRPVDGIILPVSPTTAVRKGEFRYFAYSAIANLLDYPSAVFPINRKEDDDLDEAANSDEPVSELDDIVQQSCKFMIVSASGRGRANFRVAVREEDAEGMPVCLQVMCTRLQEERVLALARSIDETLRAHSEST